MGVLSGTPLFSIGNYLRDFPTRAHELFPEIKGLEKRLAKAKSRRLPAREWLARVLFRSDWLLDKGPVRSWKSTLDSIKDHGLDAFILQQLESSLRQVAQEHDIGKAGQKWFLRNLRTKEYVRLEASPKPDESARRNSQLGIRGRFKAAVSDEDEAVNQGASSQALVATVVSAPWLTLDTGLLSMTLYPKRRGELDEEHGEGEWAGHEFDIVSEEQWQSLEHGEWTDGTEKMTSINLSDRFFLRRRL